MFEVYELLLQSGPKQSWNTARIKNSLYAECFLLSPAVDQYHSIVVTRLCTKDHNLYLVHEIPWSVRGDFPKNWCYTVCFGFDSRSSMYVCTLRRKIPHHPSKQIRIRHLPPLACLTFERDVTCGYQVP